MTLTIPVNAKDHALGTLDAPVTLVEYGDYECPYCGAAYPIVKDILSQLGHHVRFVFRNMPLAQLHPHALLAARAAEASGEQDKFWEMHDGLFENQRHLNDALVMSLASNIKLDAARFVLDLRSQRIEDRVQSDFMSGVRSGVNGTPTFFINGERFERSADELSDHLSNVVSNLTESRSGRRLRVRRERPLPRIS